jgi:hypothetical protein
MINSPINLRTPSALDSAQNDARADVNAPAALDADGARAITEEELMSLNVWGDGPKMLLNGDNNPVANFDSESTAASIFALAGQQ